MPTRPAIHQPHFAKSPEQRASAERERQRAKDALRPSTTERGYDGEWRTLRQSFIADHPICCVPGCGKPTKDVDHVESLRDHPERRLDRTNLRPFCHPHHAQRTARDQGFARRSEDRDAAPVSKGAAVMPDWLRSSRVPLRLVCGPPASGKTTYVDQHVGINEMVLDLDVIRASLSGLPIYQHTGTAGLAEALRYRNSQLGKLHSPYCKLGGAWLIVSAPKLEERAWWRAKLRPMSVVVLATPAEECHARIDADARRSWVADVHHAAVDQWWTDYQPAAGERVVRPARPAAA